MLDDGCWILDDGWWMMDISSDEYRVLIKSFPFFDILYLFCSPALVWQGTPGLGASILGSTEFFNIAGLCAFCWYKLPCYRFIAGSVSGSQALMGICLWYQSLLSTGAALPGSIHEVMQQLTRPVYIHHKGSSKWSYWIRYHRPASRQPAVGREAFLPT